MIEKNYAFVTVLTTDDYLIGVLSLNESLKRVNSKYPFIVVVNNNVKQETIEKMEKLGITVKKVESIDIPDGVLDKNEGTNYTRWNNTFDKLRIFGLTEFDKIVCLDSDMYIKANIDELFEEEHMAATIDRHYCTIDPNYMEMTSGVMVIVPEEVLDLKIAEKMIAVKNKLNQFGDQDLIQEYYSNWKNEERLHLPLVYNMFILHLDYFIKGNGNVGTDCKEFQKYNLDDLKIIHFICKKKPWQFSQNEIDEYIEFLEGIRKKDYEDCDVELQKQKIEVEFEITREFSKKLTLEYMDIIDTARKQME